MQSVPRSTYHNKILCHHLIAIESIPWIVHLMQQNWSSPVQVQVQVQVQSSPVPSQVNTQHSTASFCFDLIEQASITFDYASWETGKKWWTIPWPLCYTCPKMKDTMIWWHETSGSGSKISSRSGLKWLPWSGRSRFQNARQFRLFNLFTPALPRALLRYIDILYVFWYGRNTAGNHKYFVAAIHGFIRNDDSKVLKSWIKE